MTVTYPTNASKKVAELFFKNAGKLPQYIKKWQTFASSDCSEGSKGYHLIYIEKGHVDEGLKEVNKVNAPFFNIEGYKWKIEILANVNTASEILQAM